MMILLYDSAIRLDELLSLTVKDLIIENGSPCIKVNGKGRKNRGYFSENARTSEFISEGISPERKQR